MGTWEVAGLTVMPGGRGMKSASLPLLRRRAFMTLLGAAAVVMGGAALMSGTWAASNAAATQSHIAHRTITFGGGEGALSGSLYKPQGSGQFPALIWNHGSEKEPDTGPQFDSVASIFVPAGYVVLAPVRRGHGHSKGQYIVDAVKQKRETEGVEAAKRLAVHLLETEQLDDQLAGLAYVKQLPFVAADRIAVAGCSYGGIQTLLAAERNVGYRAAISLSPAALSWGYNPLLRKRLIQSVQGINIPVLLLQPARDASLEPSRVLGAEAARLGKPFTVKVYPDIGPADERGHCFGGAKGMHVWAEDAKAFLAAKMH
jgi:carboxymethylenebutenolidase